MFSRRDWLRASAASAAALLVNGRNAFADVALPVVTVYKDPGCGCCTKWVEHLNKNGFVVNAHNVLDTAPIKRTMGVPAKLESCHTAVVGRYVVEGHVPADLIKKVLADKPDFLGLAVPGMPAGSPGMETDTIEHYDVIAFERSGRTRVFAKR